MYELIYVNYWDGSVNYHLVKLTDDGLVEQHITFDITDAAHFLDEQVFYDAKAMSFDDFAEYFKPLEG